jgi:hypothetical protein
MSNLVTEDEPFNPKRICDDLIKRCLDAKEWIIQCYVQEEWFINGIVPFTISMKDGLYTCKVIAATKEEAIKKVKDYMPVIKFVGEKDE